VLRAFHHPPADPKVQRRQGVCRADQRQQLCILPQDNSIVAEEANVSVLLLPGSQPHTRRIGIGPVVEAGDSYVVLVKTQKEKAEGKEIGWWRRCQQRGIPVWWLAGRCQIH
jgi:hypothetical protein